MAMRRGPVVVPLVAMDSFPASVLLLACCLGPGRGMSPGFSSSLNCRLNLNYRLIPNDTDNRRPRGSDERGS